MLIKVCDAPDLVSPKKLKPHPDNPRTISRGDLDSLKESIRSKGIYRPFLVWSKGNVILSGNKRFEAVLELLDEGFELKDGLPVVFHKDPDVDLAKKILVESNTHRGDWVDELLVKLMKEAEHKGFSPDEYGLKSEDVDKLLYEAVSAVEKLPTVEPEVIEPGTAKDKGVLGEDEKFMVLRLPQDVYEQLYDILSKIAVKINPDWDEGDSLVEATQALCQSINSADILESL